MTLNATSLAAAVGASVKNVQYKPAANNVPRKIAIIGTFDPAKTLVVENVPVRILSAEDAGDRFGFGSMLHRLAIQAFRGSNGVETYAIPQEEASGASQATGTITFDATGALAGTVYMYIAGIAVPFNISDGASSDNIATAAVAAISADIDLPVSAEVDGSVTDQVNITAKTAAPWGNEISIAFNIQAGEALPTGVTAVVVDMAGGAGTPDIAEALDGMGTGDDANELFFTDVVHGYGQDSSTLNAISAYVGAGNDFLGLYDKLVSRPFRVLTGDVAAGSSGLSALTAIGDSRKLDRANGIYCVPGSRNHPGEIAAQAIGHMARINNDRAAQHYVGVPMIGIDPGEKADRWTADYDNRDTAVKAGISPTRVQNGVVTMQNVVTFYHPDSIPVSSNGYRSMRNISILQNILYNVRANFEQEKWLGISIVADVVKVSNITDRLKSKDIDAVKDDLVSLARAFESKAWIYTAGFTIDKLKEDGAVSIRPGTTGFDSILSIILSGEGAILDTLVQFDTSIAALS